MTGDFAGQTVLVTGGTRGIGWHVASSFASLGATLILTGTSAKSASGAAGRLPGAGHEGVAVDFRDEASTADFLAGLERRDRVDVCVNNAGINRIGPVDAVRDEDWAAVRAVNLDGPLRVTRAVSGMMMRRGYGRIVNISSIFGMISKRERALYSMTKFAVRGLTVASALDLAAHGILVNCVAPGFVRTELTDSILSPADQAALAAQVPLGRFAEPEEIARLVVFLCSPGNTYITAQTIVSDGGFTSV